MNGMNGLFQQWRVVGKANPHDAVLCGDEILLSMYIEI